jgi:Protein of unknown function (DUF3574)
MTLAVFNRLVCAAARTSFVRLAGLGSALATPWLLMMGMPASSLTVRRPDAVPGCADRVHVRLVFGLQGPKGPVTDAEWNAFLSDVVTPRFPDGLTIVEASGQWRGTDDRLQRERSRIVEIVQDQSADAGDRIDTIVQIYKKRHHQESVMVMRTHLEACF